MPTALITGIAGQDGSYLAELLLAKGYEVHGLVRRTSNMERPRLDHLTGWSGGADTGLHLHYADLTDSGSLAKIIVQVAPDELYNLASQSNVKVSFEMPEYTLEANASGVARLLQAILESGLVKKTRFYQASSSEMYGKPDYSPQDEQTAFRPRSPYACSKAAAHYLTVTYREAYGLFACCGILFNHESPRRGENFVTRKISLGVNRIRSCAQSKLTLGNLDARRDWGYAPEYVEGMWRMLQADAPDDYVLATGETHPVRDFVETAFAHAGLNWEDHVEIDPAFFRPVDPVEVRGNPAKARERLGWVPKTTMRDLAKLMVDADRS